MDVLTIISIVLGAIAALFGGFWLKAKGKLSQIKTLAKESYDLVNVSVSALDDNTLSKEEVAAIKKEALEVKVAWKNLMGK